MRTLGVALLLLSLGGCSSSGDDAATTGDGGTSPLDDGSTGDVAPTDDGAVDTATGADTTPATDGA
jgi:hypothetical protein